MERAPPAGREKPEEARMSLTAALLTLMHANLFAVTITAPHILWHASMAGSGFSPPFTKAD
jgi:hypothetical protein